MISFHSRHIPSNMRGSRLISTALFSTSSIGTTTTSTVKAVVAFKPWPKPVIESNGDYTDEAFLEENIGGPLYSAQNELPHLPIPSIEETIAKFLPSALPLAENKGEAQSLIKDCKSFARDAMELQKRLEVRKQSCSKKNTSWLQTWWNKLGYLQFRVSLYSISYVS